MKLRVNALLGLTSAGLLGLAGHTLYRTCSDCTPKALQDSANQGMEEARRLVIPGPVPHSQTINYNGDWWKEQFMAPNILGKEPEQPNDREVFVPRQDEWQPLSDIIELVAVMYDPTHTGKGDLSHVVVRYKGKVTRPAWWDRENQPSAVGAGASPGDVLAAPSSGPRGRQQPNTGRPGARIAPPMAMSTAGREILQKVWVAGDGTPRYEAKLWEPYANIRLVRVNENSRSAYLVRKPPSPPVGEAASPQEEELFISGVLSEEILKALGDLPSQEGHGLAGGQGSKPVEPAASPWIDDPSGETIKDRAGVFHVGVKDLDRFGDDQAWFERVNAESYVGRPGSDLRGVRLRNVDPTLAARFGVSAWEVIIAVNGELVATRSDAMAVSRRQYDRGTRTFVVTFLSNGQFVKRTYRLPPGRP